MVTGRLRSRTFRRVFRKTPGGRTVKHYKRRKPSRPVCPVTGQPLQGVARGIPSRVKKLTRSQRKPNRLYGGMLSSQASRRRIIQETRQ
ncbi:MAG: 50S ribosomal protein L34e [Candidatus Nanoarchaeia archaeon]